MVGSLIFFAALVVAISTAACDNHDDTPDWALVPQFDGSLSLENVKKLSEEYIASRSTEIKVEFVLFTNEISKSGLNVSTADFDSLRGLFNPENPTRFTIHGWRGSRDSSVNNKIRQNYLARGDYNIFVVDWGSGADTWNYIAATKNAREAGKQIGSFIDSLHQNLGLNLNTTYLIGHSLGAHVAGFTGKSVTAGRINTIFGLDPALPLFFIDKPDKRLDKGDALYVETIHTDSGVRGFDEPIGDASFYPNWGANQPGCDDSSCSHNRAVHFFAESLNVIDKFDAEQCGNYYDIVERSCQPTGKIAKMGGEPSNYGRDIAGEYYLPTNSKNPYALGAEWIDVKESK